MTVVAHLSDLHFGAELAPLAQALLIHLAADPPDIIAISGDLTQNATHREFAAGRAFLDRLPSPYLIVPGNHDIVGHRLVERFTRPFQRWRRFVTEGLAPEWSDDTMVVHGVNSARPFGPYLNWSRGRFSIGQIEAVALTAADRRPLALVAHHPIAWGNDGDHDYDLVTGAEAMLAALARQPKSMILLGHRHRSHVSLWSATGGERSATDAEVAQPGEVLIVHAGTAISDRLRGEPNGWNRLTVEASGVIVETLLFDGTGWRPMRRVSVTWPGGSPAVPGLSDAGMPASVIQRPPLTAPESCRRPA